MKKYLFLAAAAALATPSVVNAACETTEFGVASKDNAAEKFKPNSTAEFVARFTNSVMGGQTTAVKVPAECQSYFAAEVNKLNGWSSATTWEQVGGNIQFPLVVTYTPPPQAAVAETVPVKVAALPPSEVAAPVEPVANFQPQIERLQTKIANIAARPVQTGTPLTDSEKKQLASLQTVLAEIKAAQNAAVNAASNAGISEEAAAGSATAAGLSAKAAGTSAGTAKTYAEQAEAAAQKATALRALDLGVIAALALLFGAICWLFRSKASNKRVRKLESEVTNVVAEQKAIQIPAHLEDHLAHLPAGVDEEFEFVINEQEILVKFTKVDAGKLGLKRASVTTEDITDQTQPMRIDTLREKLLGHIDAGRLTAETVKQVKNTVLNLDRAA